MRLRIVQWWDDLRASYWFIPLLMTVAAFGLAFGTTILDDRLDPAWIEGSSWFYANKPDGARTLLSTVAGSMIGVAGVTFSITIASVVYASGQYGPRLLTNFMRDRGNQVTLGTFIATFVYCLLVLRTIRSADEAVDGPLSDDFVGAFVPHIALLVGLGLALASIAVLIFFIHHVPDSIRVSHVIGGVGRQLDEQVSELFPTSEGGRETEDEPEPALPEGYYDDVTPVTSKSDGYVQSFDNDGLLSLASEHGLLLRIKTRPGDFVSKGDVLLLVHPADGATEKVIRRVRQSYTHGRARSGLQDVRFLFDELVEIAARALSPGVNDPFTAINCLDWIGAAFKRLAEGTGPSAEWRDDSDVLRVVCLPTTFTEFVDLAFGQLRPYVAADRNAALHTLKVLGEIAGRVRGSARVAALVRAVQELEQACDEALPHAADRQLVHERARVVMSLLRDPRRYAEITDRENWVGGTA